MITRVFFNHRRKMIKKPFNQIFNNSIKIAEKLNLNLNLRPQNLSIIKYFEITKEYENLRH
jgi:16S rRNA (adenine1518-N6/adenine1519-N6)-dimethyltransferase